MAGGRLATGPAGWHDRPMATSDREALKRLGGGRWETRDGRFTIEPQSGTWVIVDNTATNELGLPLVRGPYGSLTAAREAIDDARAADTPTSPLAAEIERAKEKAPEAPREERPAKAPKRREPEPEEEEPAEPRWIAALDAADAKRARILLRKLERAGLRDAERVARDELTKDQPAVARAAIARRLAQIVTATDDADEAVRQVVELLADGRDRELGVGWSLVDDAGREIGAVEAADA
jgi:hypothetical protein